MKVKVKYYGALEEVSSRKEDKVELPSGATVKELLKILSKKYGKKFKDYVFEKHGEVRPYLHFLVNGTSVARDLNTELKDRDEFGILFSPGGG